jgi:histidine triad (HIT) family protein
MGAGAHRGRRLEVFEVPGACLFCERTQEPASPGGHRIFEDAHFLATLTTGTEEPFYLGQILVQTRRHARSLAELTPAEGEALGPLIQRLSSALQREVESELVYLECYMEVVRHVHFFLTARYPGTPKEFWRGGITDWPGAPRGGRDVVEKLASRLQSRLNAQRPA